MLEKKILILAAMIFCTAQALAKTSLSDQLIYSDETGTVEKFLILGLEEEVLNLTTETIEDLKALAKNSRSYFRVEPTYSSGGGSHTSIDGYSGLKDLRTMREILRIPEDNESVLFRIDLKLSDLKDLFGDGLKIDGLSAQDLQNRKFNLGRFILNCQTGDCFLMSEFSVKQGLPKDIDYFLTDTERDRKGGTEKWLYATNTNTYTTNLKLAVPLSSPFYLISRELNEACEKGLNIYPILKCEVANQKLNLQLFGDSIEELFEVNFVMQNRSEVIITGELAATLKDLFPNQVGTLLGTPNFLLVANTNGMFTFAITK